MSVLCRTCSPSPKWQLLMYPCVSHCLSLSLSRTHTQPFTLPLLSVLSNIIYLKARGFLYRAARAGDWRQKALCFGTQKLHVVHTAPSDILFSVSVGNRPHCLLAKLPLTNRVSGLHCKLSSLIPHTHLQRFSTLAFPSQSC